jgi:3-hydroxyisobutyrate dehydrogenase-like beta-hydroxyacid dehydrogenase
LHKAGCDITGFDVYKGSLDKFEAVGGKIMDTAKGAAQDAKVVVLMVVSAAQAEEVLFEKGVAAGSHIFSQRTGLVN